jgi:DNA-directed RNA polymerase II subunit RPB9
MSGTVGTKSGTSMRFCPNCNFILYPKEDKEERKLIFYCKSQRCEYEEDSDDPFVFRNQVVKTRT